MPFAVLRRILLDLGFVERTGLRAEKIFEHTSSGTLLIFRAYELNDKVNFPDLISVRKQLDERGLLAAESFDNLLRKTPA